MKKLIILTVIVLVGITALPARSYAGDFARGFERESGRIVAHVAAGVAVGVLHELFGYRHGYCPPAGYPAGYDRGYYPAGPVQVYQPEYREGRGRYQRQGYERRRTRIVREYENGKETKKIEEVNVEEYNPDE